MGKKNLAIHRYEARCAVSPRCRFLFYASSSYSTSTYTRPVVQSYDEIDQTMNCTNFIVSIVATGRQFNETLRQAV